MQQLGLDFSVQELGNLNETYPPELQKEEVPLFLARLKAESFLASSHISEKTIVITADTIVWLDNQVMGKPRNRDEAIHMLNMLSGKVHYVYTGVCLSRNNIIKAFYEESKVYFKTLTDQEIAFYVDTFQPYDKAGAYGIQEWIGDIGIQRIEGSYDNIVGLPVQKLYSELSNMVATNGLS